MTLPSSGTISLGDLQTEFGGSNPISISEYYRGGGLVPNVSANSAIPLDGNLAPISLSDFYGAKGLSSISAITSAITSNIITNRNYLFSSPWFNSGFETGTTVDVDTAGSINNYVTSVDDTETYNTLPSGLSNLVCEYTTIITYNMSLGTPTQDLLYVNGTDYTSTVQHNQLNSGYDTAAQLFNVYWVPVEFTTLSSIRLRFGKASYNGDSRQQFFTLPGRWSVVSNNYYSNNTSNTIAVLNNDVVLATGAMSFDGIYSDIVGSGTATATKLIQRAVYWYQNSVNTFEIITGDGNRTYTPSTYTAITGDVEDPTYTTYYQDVSYLHLRCLGG